MDDIFLLVDMHLSSVILYYNEYNDITDINSLENSEKFDVLYC